MTSAESPSTMELTASKAITTLPRFAIYLTTPMQRTHRKKSGRFKSKGMAGEHLGEPPYGYMKNPENKMQWVIDEPAAEIVRKIYDLCIDGKGPTQIAKILRNEKVLSVKSHYAQQRGETLAEDWYDWNSNTVIKILERMEYIGCTVNFKTYRKSYKHKKKLDNPKKTGAGCFKRTMGTGAGITEK